MIVGITGKLGSGKSAFTTWIASKHFEEGKKIFSNYPIEIPHEPLMHPFQLAVIRNGCVVLDQADDWISSVASLRKEQMALSRVYRRYRKMDNDLYFNCQRFRNINIRLRRITDIQFRLKRIPQGGKYVPVKYFEAVPFEPETFERIGKAIRFYPREVYHLFDTNAESYYSEELDKDVLDFLASIDVKDYFAGKMEKTTIDELVEER